MLPKKSLIKAGAYKPGKPIEELKRQKRLASVYKLASNEIPFAPAYAYKAVSKELRNLNRYPESSCYYLRQALAEKLRVSPDGLVFGNGSDEIITLVLKAFIEKGDEVIVSFPSFLIYQIQAEIFQAKVVRVPLKNYSYSLPGIVEKITPKTKIIFIANPDNPTGSYLTHQKMKDFFKKIPKNIIVFLDEAYYEFAPPDFAQSIKLLRQRKNTVVTRTFSKAYGLAGLRIGYGVTSREIALALNKAREPFNVNRLAQAAALSALKNSKFAKEAAEFVAGQKKYFYQNFEKLGIRYLRSATNFILVDFRKKTGGLYKYLLNRGVIIRELSGWGLDSFFRVTVGTKTQNRKFIKLLKDFKRRQGNDYRFKTESERKRY